MILALLACTGEPTGKVEPILTPSSLNPFPNADLVAGGFLSLPDDLPAAATPWDNGRFAWREGFSVAQTSVLRFDVELDETSLPGEDNIGVGGSVRMFNLDTGAELPMFAELDLHPDAVDSGQRSLLVRPMLALTPGHTVVGVVTDAVRSVNGPLPTSQWQAEGGDLRDVVLGLGVENVAWAWSFPVGDGTRPMRALAASIGVPDAPVFSEVRDDSVDTLPEATWIRAEGAMSASSWLVDDTHFVLDAEGVPQAQGMADMYVYVHIPDSVRGAAPGSVPVVLFGHGILSEPSAYLSQSDDPSNVLALTEHLGAIVIATTWRGLTTDDLIHAVEVAGDFSRVFELTDMLAQGVANNLSLLSGIREGGLLDDPVFQGLANPDDVGWYGISLGSIEGAVTLANQTTIELAALHVGGSAWSTMLERSSNWPAFEQGVTRTIEDPWERQILYATSQLAWDAVDPLSYVEDLRGRGYFWQVAMGDDQVPNLSTELFLRSLEVPLATPGFSTPYGLDVVPLPAPAPVAVQFDPELGSPPPGNRPAEETGAHGAPRHWAGTENQAVHYFETRGEVAHFCGGAGCSASNQGK